MLSSISKSRIKDTIEIFLAISESKIEKSQAINTNLSWHISEGGICYEIEHVCRL